MRLGLGGGDRTEQRRTLEFVLLLRGNSLAFEEVKVESLYCS